MYFSKQKRITAIVVSILLILTITIGVFIFTNQENKTVEATTSLASGTKSIVNLNAQGGIVDNFTPIITGAQNEYIYFGDNFAVGVNGNTGTNAHTGAIKWRVLSANDTKYSNGNMLLWSDYIIGTRRYQTRQTNQGYAYWGMSEMRAWLNGGDCLADVGAQNTTKIPTETTNVADTSSWFYKLFTSQEKKNIVESQSYETKNWGYDAAAAPRYITSDIVGTGNGKYSTSFIDTLSGTYATQVGTSVIETTQDYLFLLDYFDINNTAYGFGDSGVVYANKVNPSWNTSSEFYPGYNDDNGAASSNYLKTSNDISSDWWIRPAGRFQATDARVLYVHSSGFINNDHVTSSHGIRPAFNFNPANIIYATAADTTSIGNQFVQVGGSISQPAYKVYLKSDTFTNYNSLTSGQPQIKISGNNVSVELAGKSGKAIFLIADKSGSGDVKYQAVADFDGSGVATATLPSGVKAENNSITVLFADTLRGDNYAETITGSYTNVILDSPTKVTTTYTGSKLTIADIADAQKPWYDSALIDITYPTGYADGMTNVGTYTVKAEIKSEYRTNTIFSGEPDTSKGENAYTRYFDYEITKKLLDYPTFFDGDSKYYDDGRGVLFTLVYESNAIEIKHKGAVLTGNQIEESAVNKYSLVVSLKDSDNYAWKTTPPSEFGFEITRKPIEVKLHDGNDGYNLTGMRGSKLKVELDMPNGEYINTGETVEIKIYANITGLQPFEIGKYTLDSTSREEDIELDLTRLPENQTYDLSIETTTGNYDIKLSSQSPTKLTVTKAVSTPILTWNLYANGVKQRRQYVESKVGEDYDVTFANREYDGKSYSFKVDLPNGYILDPSHGVGGYLVTHVNTENTNVGANADTYTTSVRLVNTTTNNGEVYSIEFTIDKAKFDLSKVNWKGNGTLEFNGQSQSMVLENLPDKLQAYYYGDESHREVTTSPLRVNVDYLDFVNASDSENYLLPDIADTNTYDGTVAWEIDWNIVPRQIAVQWGKELSTDKNNNAFNVAILRSKAENTVVVHTYYKSDGQGNKIDNTPINVSDIVVPTTGTDYYICELSLSSSDGYVLSGTLTREFAVSYQGTAVEFTPNNLTFQYTGKGIAPKFTNSANLQSGQYTVTYYAAGGASALTSAPTAVGKYRVEITLDSAISGEYFIGGNTEWEYEIVSRIINESWNENVKPPRMNINKTELEMIEYEFQDENGNTVTFDQMKTQAGVYSVRAKIKSEYAGNCSFASGNSETEWIDFELTEQDLTNMQDPTDSTLYPDDPDMQEPTEPSNPDDNNPSGNVPGSGDEGGSGTLDEILAKLKEIPLWQMIASVISIILIIIFLSKTAGYESKRKKFNKKADKLESSVYAGAFLGLAMTGWTAIACVLMGLAVVSLVIMLIAKSRCNKAEENYEDCLEEYNRNQKDLEERKRASEKEDMKMMFMSMMGGNAGGGMPQGGYMGGGYVVQQGLGADEIRGIVSETMTALLPGMQQLLPQQASSNDEVIKQIMKTQEELAHNQELMMKKMSEQPVERIVEKEVAATTVNDETIKQMMKNQEMLMEKILELSAAQPQVVEKVVEVPVEVEKIVEKEVPVEVEKIVEKEVVKEVPVEVEKIVEKEVRVEVPVEKVVEKVVEKEVKVEVSASVKAPKEKAPRLTLDEAYARLSKQQKKYFDGLREYALTKDKCKEKKSTYFILLGQSSVNPLVKLTIKKDTTVALFKMEDEYLKDIKRDATGEGTKVKVKETEVIIDDAQAFATAKRMVNLREDQIDRYQEYMKEQRLMKNKK